MVCFTPEMGPKPTGRRRRAVNCYLEAIAQYSYATDHHLHILKIILEKYIEYNFQLYLCFIDYSKAFDSISNNIIRKVLSA